MAVYRLICSCGQAHRVETSAAGRIIECSCGNQLTIPSMRQIRALPLWDETPEDKPEDGLPAAGAEGSRPQPAANTQKSPEGDDNAPAASASPLKKGGVLRGNRKGFLLVGVILAAIFSCLLFYTIRHKPRPIEVLRKQRSFLLGKTLVQRDSLPVTMEDFKFYIDQIDEESLSFYQLINSVTVTEDNLQAARKVFPDIKVGDRFLPINVELGQWVEINDWLLDRMTPVMAYRYFDQLKNGPQLSDNFYENLDMLHTQYKFKVAMYSILIGLSVILCAVPWMLPKHDYVVGAMRGSVWKA
ncbi:MAG: hypothetical protein IJH68_12605 [Thermoguttaceae bacterium]|nr:hypothetical protein [Thermoguttaceae bacterium]